MLLLLAMIAGLVALDIFAGSGCGFNFFLRYKTFLLESSFAGRFYYCSSPFQSADN